MLDECVSLLESDAICLCTEYLLILYLLFDSSICSASFTSNLSEVSTSHLQPPYFLGMNSFMNRTVYRSYRVRLIKS